MSNPTNREGLAFTEWLKKRGQQGYAVKDGQGVIQTLYTERHLAEEHIEVADLVGAYVEEVTILGKIPFKELGIEDDYDDASEDSDDEDSGTWKQERATQAGMMGGVSAYNEVMGYDSYSPEPCGHHCGSGCPRCGDY
jgi:hypothetical protein